MIMQLVNPSLAMMSQALEIHHMSFLGAERAPSSMFLHHCKEDFFFADVVENTVRAYALVEGRQPFWWLWEMAVAPSYRKQHIASGLLDHVIEAAKQVGEHGIELTVNAKNEEAWTLYNRKKFVDVRRLKNYYLGADGILMRRDI